MSGSNSSGASTQPQSPFPPITPSDEFAAASLPPPVPLIEGIIDQGSKLAIGGGSKSYKSWVLLDLALSIATGTEWLGFKTQKNRVLYVNFEIPDSRFQERLRMIAKEKGFSPPAELFIWNLRGVAADTISIKTMILQKAKELKIGLVIIDPLYKYGGGIDENSTADMIKLFNDLDRIIGGAGAGVCYAGHFSKGNQAAKNPIDRVSGSGVHGREPDAIINFTSHKETKAYTVDITLRYMPEQAPFVVRWTLPIFTIDKNLDPADLLRKPGTGRPPKLVPAQLLHLLQSQKRIASTKDFLQIAERMFGVSKNTIRKVLKELVVFPAVRHDATDAWWYDPTPSN